MSDVPAAPQPSPGPFASAWSQIWVRAAILFGAWAAIAVFFYAIGSDHVRPAHQAALIISWGIIGVAFGGCWLLIEGALASWMERTGTERKKLIAVGFYLVFLVLMIVVLTVVSSGADPDDWHFMAYLAFLVVAGLPSATLAERLGG
jgi:MFS family permease